jgi:hypothetical protein
LYRLANFPGVDCDASKQLALSGASIRLGPNGKLPANVKWKARSRTTHPTSLSQIGRQFGRRKNIATRLPLQAAPAFSWPKSRGHRQNGPCGSQSLMQRLSQIATDIHGLRGIVRFQNGPQVHLDIQLAEAAVPSSKLGSCKMPMRPSHAVSYIVNA